MIIRVTQKTLQEIDLHAAEAYPRECCGVVLGDGDCERVRRIENIQDRLHAEDPAAYPRDSSTAYFMDPQQLYVVLREAEQDRAPIRLFYHSHPEHGAYFSKEDQARALAWDEPAYPGASYFVVSVMAGRVADRLAVTWNAERREFVPTEVAVA
ncbi:MAG: M67 family metallopeptidase [Candidatus Binatia bacterium]